MAGDVLRLWFLRHGQTELSRQDRFCGDTDAALSELGHRMAKAFGEHHASSPWTALYSSPKMRARQTIAPLVERVGMPVTYEDGFREISYGEWEQRSGSELRREDPERFEQWLADPVAIGPPGGETAGQIAERAMRGVEELRRRHAHGNVLVVSHKATIRILICAFLGVDLRLYRVRFAAPVCSVAMVSFRSTGPELERLGDQSHLPLELRGDLGT